MKYNFYVERDETPYYHYLAESSFSHKYVLKIKTNIKVENDKIYIFFNKENAKNIYGKDIQNWKYGSFKFQNREANIKDIQSIQYKNCFLLSFRDLLLSLFLFVMVLGYFFIKVESMVSSVRDLRILGIFLIFQQLRFQ